MPTPKQLAFYIRRHEAKAEVYERLGDGETARIHLGAARRYREQLKREQERKTKGAQEVTN